MIDNSIGNVGPREVWKIIQRYPKYEASNLGKIRIRKNKRILSQSISPKGYYRVSIFLNGVNHRVDVHRLMTNAFYGPLPDGYHTRHLDGDKLNNTLSNLKYGTPKENCMDTIRHGRTLPGECNPNNVWTEEKILKIVKLYRRGHTKAEIARILSINDGTVSNVLLGNSWSTLTGITRN